MKKAFTLIELLVVIAIISVLMGILMPVLGRVKKQAHQSVCASNLRQIGIGAALYAQDNDYAVPRGAGGGNQNIWFQVFMPYMAQAKGLSDYREVKVFRCPSYPDKAQTVCYVINGWDFTSQRDLTGKEIINYDGKFKLTGYQRLSETIYLADNEDGVWREIVTSVTSAGLNKCDVWHPTHMPTSTSISASTNQSRRVAQARHRNGCNVLFTDWHVEWMAAEDMTIDMWRFYKQ
jgi:prepilin-type N-terminal cleavage/methylation domain-containing protein/prepilin-type processing-associated H-X9-DG protein